MKHIAELYSQAKSDCQNYTDYLKAQSVTKHRSTDRLSTRSLTSTESVTRKADFVAINDDGKKVVDVAMHASVERGIALRTLGIAHKTTRETVILTEDHPFFASLIAAEKAERVAKQKEADAKLAADKLTAAKEQEKQLA